MTQLVPFVGTWTLDSIKLEQDGKKTDFYGPNPQGQENRASSHTTAREIE
jgi:hypothetical protein